MRGLLILSIIAVTSSYPGLHLSGGVHAGILPINGGHNAGFSGGHHGGGGFLGGGGSHGFAGGHGGFGNGGFGNGHLTAGAINGALGGGFGGGDGHITAGAAGFGNGDGHITAGSVGGFGGGDGHITAGATGGFGGGFDGHIAAGSIGGGGFLNGGGGGPIGGSGPAGSIGGGGFHHSPVVTKDFYFHAAADEHDEDFVSKTIDLGPARKHYRVVFIKAPTQSSKAAALQILQAQNEEKTVIYVLSKKTDGAEIHAEIQGHQQVNNKPEVFFIKYKTPDEAIHAQQQIQAQYDSLGGVSRFSDEGVSPVTSVIGSLGGGSHIGPNGGPAIDGQGSFTGSSGPSVDVTHATFVNHSGPNGDGHGAFLGDGGASSANVHSGPGILSGNHGHSGPGILAGSHGHSGGDGGYLPPPK